jgi:hypothetical protein
MPPFFETSLLTKMAALAQLTLVFLCFLCIVALRFQRRGSARFWAAPAIVALALLPPVVAAGVTAVAFRTTLGAVALTGSGGIAALAAGSAESLVLLLVGLASAALLAFAGVLITSIGSSRARYEAPGGSKALPLVSLAAVGLSAWLVVLVARFVDAVNADLRDPEVILTRWRLAIAGSIGLALLLLVLAIVTAVRAPRGASKLGANLISLSTLAVVGLGALVGLWLVYAQVQCLTAVALTGKPCDALPRGAAQEPGARAPN